MYKDKDKQKEYNKERMRKARVAQQGNTKEGSTYNKEGKNVLPEVEMVPPAYVPGVTGEFMVLPERPRYLTLHDGQVLDRLNLPTSCDMDDRWSQSMMNCNESEFNYHPTKQRAKIT